MELLLITQVYYCYHSDNLNISCHLANASTLPALSVAMTTKLKQLTLVSMASQCQVIMSF